MSTRIIVGEALERLRELPDESVHCVVTSPPYWGLRAYGGDAGMIGLEPTFDDHLSNLVAVFREVRRVLRNDGTLWLNYGDAYAGAPPRIKFGDQGDNGVDETTRQVKNIAGLKTKDLMMMPARVAMALQADGWWLRSEIIWHKPNPMPESVTDRPTSAHEKVFLLSKRAKYYYDAEAVRVPSITGDNRRPKGSNGAWELDGRPENQRHGGEARQTDASCANMRNVWSIATFAYPGSHFATFPPALVEPCIKAGTSAQGVCGKCGAPWERQVEKGIVYTQKVQNPKGSGDEANNQGDNRIRDGHIPGVPTCKTTGWQPTCEHSAEVRPATVLDPFAGSGTVGLVADRLGRDAILIELNPEYAAMAEQRIVGENPLFCKVEVKG